jgi:hypothetical protein
MRSLLFLGQFELMMLLYAVMIRIMEIDLKLIANDHQNGSI